MVAAMNKALGAIPLFGIGLLNWGRVLFILNRYRGWNRFSKPEMLALLLFVFGGFSAWIGEMSILSDSLLALQVVASLFRATLNWFGMLLIVNERLYVTRQQFGSLCFIAIISFLWELTHRIVLN
tara:strand:+ start:1039 stop:1413 length:375 start_codon:yes stop_codon:yes gene_type:complete